MKTFDHADADHDGKMSRDEWLTNGLPPALFDAYDADGDGIISPEACCFEA